MKEEGNEVIVVTTNNRFLISISKYNLNGITTYRIPTLSLWIPKFPRIVSGALNVLLTIFDPISYFVLRKIIKEEKPDIVHSHNTSMISFGSLRAAKKPIKIIQTYHGYFYECPKGGLLKKWTTSKEFEICKRKNILCQVWIYFFKKVVPIPDATIAISRYIFKKLKKTNAKKLYYCPNGIECNFRFKNISAKKRNRKKIILFIGRITKAKGVGILIESYNRIRKVVGNTQLWIIGDGPALNEFKNKAKNLKKEVIFFGRISHEKIYNIYKYAYVVIVPSLWYEVLNTVAIEASLMNKPVIASDLPGFHDIVINKVTGLLFEVGNIDDLYNKLLYILSDENIALKYGENACKNAKKFTLTNHKKNLLKIYNEVLTNIK